MGESLVKVRQKGRALSQKERDIVGLKWMNLLQKRARDKRLMPYHYLRVNQ